MNFKSIVYSLILLSVFYVFTQCEKATPTFTENGQVLYTGLLVNNGCEWLLKVNAEFYKTEGLLSSAYLKDSLLVNVTFEKLNKYYHCGNVKSRYRIIRVKQIRNR